MLNGSAFAPNGIVTRKTCPVCQEPFEYPECVKFSRWLAKEWNLALR